MPAGVYNITCKRNADLDLSFILQAGVNTPMDLSGYKGKMQVRPSTRSATLLLNLTSENGGIIIYGAEGKVQVYAKATQLQGMRSIESSYDLILISPEGKTFRYLEGTFTVEYGITELG